MLMVGRRRYRIGPSLGISQSVDEAEWATGDSTRAENNPQLR